MVRDLICVCVVQVDVVVPTGQSNPLMDAIAEEHALPEGGKGLARPRLGTAAAAAPSEEVRM